MPDDDSQILVPAAFMALFVPEGRLRPVASRAEITARYEFCEALAHLLLERAGQLQWELGITRGDVLERVGTGLAQPDAGVSDAEAGWVVGRLGELLDEARPYGS